jgi:hypothetical protein
MVRLLSTAAVGFDLSVGLLGVSAKQAGLGNLYGAKGIREAFGGGNN